MNLVNGVKCDTISVSDRGLAYGDGVFRTFVLRAGRPLLWRQQYAKLAADCGALRISCPDAALFESDLSAIAAQLPDSVVKIIVTRGSGPRGYAITNGMLSQRIVSSAPLPVYPQRYYDAGVRVCLCRTRLAAQPLLAGIKHLNRLENVLARAEWSDPDIAEGLMCDVDGKLICGTMSNLFLVKEGALLTADLTHCGVAGVTRQLVIEFAHSNSVPLRITALSIDDVIAADELFLVNSVIGVWQVTALDSKTWSTRVLTTRIRAWISDAQKH